MVSGKQPDQDAVRCHSGYTYAQRPVSFTHDGKDYRVARVITEMKFPDGKQFLVETESGQIFKLTFSESSGDWLIRNK